MILFLLSTSTAILLTSHSIILASMLYTYLYQQLYHLISKSITALLNKCYLYELTYCLLHCLKYTHMRIFSALYIPIFWHIIRSVKKQCMPFTSVCPNLNCFVTQNACDHSQYVGSFKYTIKLMFTLKPPHRVWHNKCCRVANQNPRPSNDNSALKMNIIVILLLGNPSFDNNFPFLPRT